MASNTETQHKRNWIERNYSTRRGFARTLWHQSIYYFGGYRDYLNIDWGSVKRLVFICKGNICRSAYSEAFAKALKIESISCGLDTIERAPANPDAIRIAMRRGISLTEHKTQPIMYLTLCKTDLLVVMEPWQALFLKQNLVREHQITLLGLWSKPIRPHIQDPFGASAEYFELCFNHIEDYVKKIANKIKQ
ncbi:MAG: phosphotyrosine protein phosphatase [Gammaproteobacteria bacterium]|nr:phosphotyrosine protein phosphatase [Gammaproteobacteria bacterium]